MVRYSTPPVSSSTTERSVLSAGGNVRSRTVSSDQTRSHPRLARVIARHRARPSQRPLSHDALAELGALERELVELGGEIILDSGCGTGESSLDLARAHPDAVIVGIDKSATRLARAPHAGARNLRYVRADLADVWRFARLRAWRVGAHFLLYPNPWPKQRHLRRRWHAHPALDDLIALGGRLELRTNWAIYAEEFATALALWCAVDVAVETWRPASPASAFERKYLASGHTLYRVVIDLPR